MPTIVLIGHLLPQSRPYFFESTVANMHLDINERSENKATKNLLWILLKAYISRLQSISIRIHPPHPIKEFSIYNQIQINKRSLLILPLATFSSQKLIEFIFVLHR